MTGRRIATATGRGAGRPGRVRSSCRSPSCARAASSQACWSRVGARNRRCWPSCRGLRVRVSTRRVDQLVERLGLRISTSEVSRVCGALDEHVDAFRSRPLEGRYPYVFLDAKLEKVRAGGRVVNKALVIAHGVHETGRREILSIDVGEAETEAFWTEFLRGLVKRGLTGVQLAISDAHGGSRQQSTGSSRAPGSAAPSISSEIASGTPAKTNTASWAR